MAGVEKLWCGWGGKLLGRINSMYAGSLAYVRVNGGVSERFRIDSGVRQSCIMFPWLFNVYMDAVMKEVKMEIGRRGLPGFLYADDLVLCGVSEKALRAMVGRIVEMCRRRELKVKPGKRK